MTRLNTVSHTVNRADRDGLESLITPIPSISRRKCFLSTSLFISLLLINEQTWAGGQLEEPLIDSVRTALSAAVNNTAPPVPEFSSTEARLKYLRWQVEMSVRLKKKKPDWQARQDFLQTVWYEAKRAGLDVALVLGLVQVESNFRKFAVSSVGARGYMQVMPFWVRVLAQGNTTRGDAGQKETSLGGSAAGEAVRGEAARVDAGKLFHMQTNLRFGCVILRHYLDREKGDLFMGLGRYNGSRGKSPYPNAVLGAKRQWEFTPP